MRFLVLSTLSLLLVYTNIYAGTLTPNPLLKTIKADRDSLPATIKPDRQLTNFTAALLNQIVYKSVSNGVKEGSYRIALECTINAKGKVTAIKISPETNEQIKKLITEALENHQFEISKANGGKGKSWKHVFTFMLL